ncbi:DExH-box ATP-dependent RNA helicase DExH18, mitochondrial [Arachis stenosperma]|uniref:DExH-box ATP-dependent RNA helicase DExH18, mitochondrial n=1 Tax=Arachis stenosperma TaxID=217475 RepID=UPI0025AB7199|nr:DExH-box ATP-dependent RNA helicase DExH18, mitochondrial [Arachis stenosperma]
MATTLFNLCTRRRTIHRLKVLLLSNTHHFSAASTSQFRNFDAPIRSFSTHFRKPRFPLRFLQSWNLSGGTTLPMRQFSDDAGDGGGEKDTAAESDYEFGKSVSFEPENEVNGVSSLSGSVVVENDDTNECNSEVDDDSIECNSSSSSSIGRDELENNNNNNNNQNSEEFASVALRDPVELYRALCDAKKGAKLERSEGEVLLEVFNYFAKSGWASNQALAIYIGLSFFPTAASKFHHFFRKKCPADVARYLVSLGPSDSAVKFLFPIFVEFCLDNFPDEIKRFRGMVAMADLTKPHTWFPFARAMKRKIIYHCGPTNSGKTYNALQRFMDAKKGIYCSPLRLLAMEVFDKVNAKGIYCSLLTGQEKKHVPFSNHVACTVEMVSMQELYDVAIIDEIQMMSDPYRGYAWTRALLGLKADEIHLCGDPSVLDIVRKICQDTGDELYEQHYERFKPLVVEAKTLLGNLQNIQSGDCVVAFSRREIFEVKLAIEKQTKHRCCVIYGALPPETRRHQATLFNDQSNEYDVLVASDAVGMGLNLNIRRVIFNNLSKYNGDKMVPVPASQVKQIAGRAGRRGCLYPDGLATTMHLDDLDYLIECLKQPFDEVKKVGLFPFFEQVELFASQLPNLTFCQLLEKFGESCRLDGSYFLCLYDHIKKIANMLERVQGLSLEDRFNFCFAPVNIRDPKAMYHLLRFATTFSQNMPVNIAMGLPRSSARNDSELLDLETRHQVLSMYLWLSNHFKQERFPYVKKAEAMATDIADLLAHSLTNANWKPLSRRTRGKPKAEKGEGQPESGNAVVLKTGKHSYLRPQALSKLYDRRRQDKPLQVDQSKKVAA